MSRPTEAAVARATALDSPSEFLNQQEIENFMGKSTSITPFYAYYSARSSILHILEPDQPNSTITKLANPFACVLQCRLLWSD